MFNTEFDKEILQFTKENISLDIDSAKSNEDICFHYGISYYYTNNGFDILHTISRKYATKEILRVEAGISEENVILAKLMSRRYFCNISSG